MDMVGQMHRHVIQIFGRSFCETYYLLFVIRPGQKEMIG